MEDMGVSIDVSDAEKGLEEAAALAAHAREESLKESAEGMCAEMRAAVNHPASKGEKNSPEIHTRTGNLLQSIEWDYEENWDMAIARAGDVSGSAPYAKALEEGTPKMRARPFLAPALWNWARSAAGRIRERFAGGARD